MPIGGGRITPAREECLMERETLTVNNPSQIPSILPGLNVPVGLSGVGDSLPARRLHRSHSQSHSELTRTCEGTEEGTRGDKGWRASTFVDERGARLR